MHSKRFSLFACAVIAAMMLWPANAAAQRGHGGGGGGGPHGGAPAHGRPVYGGPVHGGGTHVAVGIGWGYPYYYSPFYSPFYFGVGFGWYSGWWGGPYYPYYAYGYPPYPYAGYPYGYYGWSSARIEVKPREAQVYVDGYYAGVVNDFDGVFQRLDVPPGNHELAIYLQGYHTYRDQMLFSPGSSYHIKTVLQPLAPGTPPEPQPQPDPSQQRPAPHGQGQGRYGPPPDQGGYYPPPNQGGGYPSAQPERRQTPPQPAGQFGTLSLRVQPGDAVVVIDGERWDSGGSRLIVQLSGGSHRVEVSKDGYRPYSTSVDIRPGETQDLNISLPPGQ